MAGEQSHLKSAVIVSVLRTYFMLVVMSKRHGFSDRPYLEVFFFRVVVYIINNPVRVDIIVIVI